MTAAMKALGMTQRQVATMVTASAFTLGAVGALLGIPAGLILYQYLIQAMASVSNFTISTSVIIAQISPLRTMPRN